MIHGDTANIQTSKEHTIKSIIYRTYSKYRKYKYHLLFERSSATECNGDVWHQTSPRHSAPEDLPHPQPHSQNGQMLLGFPNFSW